MKLLLFPLILTSKRVKGIEQQECKTGNCTYDKVTLASGNCIRISVGVLKFIENW